MRRFVLAAVATLAVAGIPAAASATPAPAHPYLNGSRIAFEPFLELLSERSSGNACSSMTGW